MAAMAPRRARSSSDVGNLADVASNVTSERDATRAFTWNKRRKVSTDTFDGLAVSLEEENFEYIYDSLAGNFKAQAMVIKGIKEGKFNAQAKAKENAEEKAAPSTNKFNMLSIDNWACILQQVDAGKFQKDQLAFADKGWLCKVGCWAGGVDPTSALVDRKLSVIASFIKKRAAEIFGNRHSVARFSFDAASQSVTRCHNFDEHEGCFFAEYADHETKDAGHIVHRGTNARVPIPSEFLGSALKFKSNHSQKEA